MERQAMQWIIENEISRQHRSIFTKISEDIHLCLFVLRFKTF